MLIHSNGRWLRGWLLLSFAFVANANPCVVEISDAVASKHHPSLHQAALDLVQRFRTKLEEKMPTSDLDRVLPISEADRAPFYFRHSLKVDVGEPEGSHRGTAREMLARLLALESTLSNFEDAGTISTQFCLSSEVLPDTYTKTRKRETEFSPVDWVGWTLAPIVGTGTLLPALFAATCYLFGAGHDLATSDTLLSLGNIGAQVGGLLAIPAPLVGRKLAMDRARDAIARNYPWLPRMRDQRQQIVVHPEIEYVEIWEGERRIEVLQLAMPANLPEYLFFSTLRKKSP